MAKYKQHEDIYKIARCPVCGKIFDGVKRCVV